MMPSRSRDRSPIGALSRMALRCALLWLEFSHRSLETGQISDEYHSRSRVLTVESYSLKKHWKDRPV